MRCQSGIEFAKHREFERSRIPVLSEHEILELLEQLKFGALGGIASDSDPVGHWPVLVGDGICLNLQSAARAEFVRQPEQVTVPGGLADRATLGIVSSCYRQLHHVSTGVQNRSLVMAYDDECLKLFPRLHLSGRNRSGPERELEDNMPSGHAYDFSLAVASSLDSSARAACDDRPVVFLPLDLPEETQFTCGWRVAVEFGHNSAEFFVGLLNPGANERSVANRTAHETAMICVKPESVTRSPGASEICVNLGDTEWLGLRRSESMGHYHVTREGGDITLIKPGAPAHLPVAGSDRLAPEAELIVQKSLQLSVDDVYLLLLEAIGCDSKITIEFIAESVFGELDDFNSYLLPEHSRLRCLSINGLPVRNSHIIVEEGYFRLQSSD